MLAKIAFGNVRKSFKDFAIYFVTVMLGVAVFYAFNAMATQQGVLAFNETQDKIFGLLGTVIGGVSLFIAGVLVFLVVYASRFLIRRRKKEFGLYLLLGMQPAQVSGIILWESLIVGATSLAAGIVLGVGLSQVLLAVTAALFQAGINVAETGGFAFVFSADALVFTLEVFAVIFALSAIFNVRTIGRTPIIQLIAAEHRHETLKLTNLLLSFVLFVLALACIALAYKLLLENGLMGMGPKFVASTVLVIVGTFLFFFSLSGFLLKIVQAVRPLYFRGLNMFTLRQLNAKVNTAFSSLSVVCLILFLAITSTCGGIGIRNALENSAKAFTDYAASVTTYWGQFSPEGGFQPSDLDAADDLALAADGGMAEGLARSAEAVGFDNWELLAPQNAQLNFYALGTRPLSVSAVEEAVGRPLITDTGAAMLNPDYGTYPFYLLKLSEVNAALELAGRSPIQLGEGKAAIIADSDLAKEFCEYAAETHASIPLGETSVNVAAYYQMSLQTSAVPMNTGSLVVNDGLIESDGMLLMSVLDIQTAPENEGALWDCLEAIRNSSDASTWPISNFLTRTLALDQSVSLAAIIAFLAIYLGFVLVVACAAILAIQQLSNASESAASYTLLRKLGAPESMITCSVFTQVLVYFLFPLLLGLAHTACALIVVTDVVSVIGHLDITAMALACAASFLVVYGAYFAVTFFASRRLARPAAT